MPEHVRLSSLLVRTNRENVALANYSSATVPITPKEDPQASPTSSSAAPSSGLGRSYERFLEMPVAFVLVVLWLAGVALMGSCALLVYLAVWALI